MNGHIRILSKRDRIPAGTLAIDTTTHSRNWSRSLSPMLLGPCKTPDGLLARTVEQLWQYSKVYSCHMEGDEILPEFDAWRSQGFKAPRAERYPMGRGAKPEFSLWGEERLGYIEARKAIYFPIYRDALTKSPAWATLERIHQSGRDIALIDFDGYDHERIGKSLQQVLDDPKRIMGHAFVIKAMLLHGSSVQPKGLA